MIFDFYFVIFMCVSSAVLVASLLYGVAGMKIMKILVATYLIVSSMVITVFIENNKGWATNQEIKDRSEIVYSAFREPENGHEGEIILLVFNEEVFRLHTLPYSAEAAQDADKIKKKLAAGARVFYFKKGSSGGKTGVSQPGSATNDYEENSIGGMMILNPRDILQK